MYLQENLLRAELLGGGYTWFDTGTFDSNLEASNMIRSIQENKGRVICCPEQIAYSQGWINDELLEKSANEMRKNSYGEYLNKTLERGRK